MLAKLISLLVHAKAGAISGVFLLGATGALVSVSATTNGVTTITVTQASPSPSTAAQVAANSAKPSKSPEPEESSEPTPATAAAPVAPTAACTDEAAAIAAQVQRVNTAFSTFHTDLEKLRGTRDSTILKKADLTLQLTRWSAVKAIHATLTADCVKKDDEDTDEDQDEQGDNDDHKAPPAPASVLSVIETPMANDTENDDRDGKVAITFTGTTPTAIADEAIALMQTAFDAAKNSPVTTPPPSHTPKVEPLHGTTVDPSHAPKVDPKRAPVQMDSKGHHD